MGLFHVGPRRASHMDPAPLDFLIMFAIFQPVRRPGWREGGPAESWRNNPLAENVSDMSCCRSYCHLFSASVCSALPCPWGRTGAFEPGHRFCQLPLPLELQGLTTNRDKAGNIYALGSLTKRGNPFLVYLLCVDRHPGAPGPRQTAPLDRTAGEGMV